MQIEIKFMYREIAYGKGMGLCVCVLHLVEL